MKLKAALFFVLTAVGLHIYLTLHYYGLNFGLLTGESMCNVNAAFNCDTVAASPFSAIFGIPLALWGAVTNSLLAIFIAAWALGWSDDIPRLSRYTLWLSGFIALASVVMGAISVIGVGSYCLFCIGAYLTSFLTFALLYKAREPNARSPMEYLTELYGPAKNYAFLLLAIPLVTLFFHYSYISDVGAKELNLAIKSSLAEWSAGRKVDLSATPPAMSKGPENAKMTIEEFADFRCAHCKHAAPGLKAFLNSRRDVRLKFYAYPLDGTCNSSMGTAGGDGISCFLAKAVYCAEKVAQQGWPMHDEIFARQEEINKNSNIEFARQEVDALVKHLNIPAEPQKNCIESSETDAAIRAQAQAGSDAGVKGTPTVIVNGRKLSRGQLLPVLEAVHKSL